MISIRNIVTHQKYTGSAWINSPLLDATPQERKESPNQPQFDKHFSLNEILNWLICQRVYCFYVECQSFIVPPFEASFFLQDAMTWRVPSSIIS